MQTFAGLIEAALLCRRLKDDPADLTDRLAAAVAARLARGGQTATSVEAGEAGARRMIFAAFEIGLSAAATAFPEGTFASALGTRFAAIRPNDYGLRVAAHRAGIAMTVRATGEIARTDLVVAAHRALAAIVAAARPDLVYWGLTDTLFLPEELPPTEGIGFPASLVLRPEIRLGGADPRGRRRHGFVAGGSEEWFGKPVVVEPTTHPLAETLAFVDLCLVARLQGDDLIGRDGLLPVTEALTVAVRHMPPGRVFPHGYIALSFETRGRPERLRPPAGAPAARLPEGLAAKPAAKQAGGPPRATTVAGRSAPGVRH